MSIIIQQVKFSLIGNYNFFDASPSNYTKTNFLTTKHKYIPNQITVNNINEKGLQLIPRILYYNQITNSNIVFLPDRIDFEFNRKSKYEEINYFVCSDIVKPIIHDFLENIDVSASRLAIFLFGFVDDKKENKLIKNDNFYNVDQFVEWSDRIVIRKDVQLGNKIDKMNIVLNQNYDEKPLVISLNNINVTYDCVQFQIDINTIFKNSNNNYKILDLINFIDVSSESVSETLGILEGVYYE